MSEHGTHAVSALPVKAKQTLILGAILMGLAVALGAFGAHGLKAHTDAYGLATWETAVRYQAWHSLALLFLALGWNAVAPKMLRSATICMVLGILIISGSLYVLVLSGLKWLGAITPIGGILLIAGWILTAVGAARR